MSLFLICHVLGMKMFLYFTVDVLLVGLQVGDHELIPGGSNVKVTDENKHEYVNLVAEYRLTEAIRPQINSFLEGFYELIPRNLISLFNDKELELAISGLPQIDSENSSFIFGPQGWFTMMLMHHFLQLTHLQLMI